MQIDIKAHKFDLTDSLRNYAERRLRFALTCCNDHIHRVVMRLSDINGPRGGEDKHCHLQIVLSGLPDVIVEDTEHNLYVAIDRATDRAGRAVCLRSQPPHGEFCKNYRIRRTPLGYDGPTIKR